MTWTPINWAALGDQPPVEPTISGLVYPGRRHVFSGPPESAKTWAAFAIGLEHIRGGGVVVHIDFEMYAHETRDRLRAMGATPAELERFLHVEPETEATDDVIAELVTHYKPTLAIIDAAAGAYALQGLDDNARKDAEKFAGGMIDPFRARKVGSVLLDHVTKNADARGSFAIGSERKIGAADVHLGFEAVTKFGRGRNGLIRIVTHKDRFGYLPRPRAAELELRSDPDTHAISWEFRAAEQTAGDGWRPTILMEKVSRHLEQQTEPASRSSLAKKPEDGGVGGKREYVLQAIDALVADGYAQQQAGLGGAKLISSLKPFRVPDPFPVPTLYRGNGYGTGQDGHTHRHQPFPRRRNRTARRNRPRARARMRGLTRVACREIVACSVFSSRTGARAARSPAADRCASVLLTERQVAGFPHHCAVSSGPTCRRLPPRLPGEALDAGITGRYRKLYSHAMEAATKQRTPSPREDPVAAGAAGGVASGAVRRGKSERHWLAVLSDEVQDHPEQVARAVLRSKNAAAIASALQLVQAHERTELRTLRDIERRASAADEQLCALLDEVDEESARVAQLREQVAGLEERRRGLHTQLQSDSGLDAWLGEVGESKVAASLARLGWLEVDDVGGGDDAAAAA